MPRTSGLSCKIIEAVRLVTILQSRGVDLSSIKSGWMIYIRRIIAEKLLPEVLQRFGRTRVTDAIGRLPHAEQRRLASGEHFPFVENPDAGDGAHMMVDPLKLETLQQIRQLFAVDHIRDIAEQRLWLASQREASKAKLPDSVPVGNKEAKIDRLRQEVKLGNYVISKAELLEMIRALG